MSDMKKNFGLVALSRSKMLVGSVAFLSAAAVSTLDASAGQRRAQGSNQALNLTAKGSGPVRDTYCGGHNQVKCDFVFVAVCKLDGGVLSPSGTICWNKNVW